MTCNEVRARELVEQYLSGRLPETESTSFEVHYFECERCFEELEIARHMRDALAARAPSIRREPLPAPKTWLLWLAPIALAAALGVVAVMVWQHSSGLRPRTQVAQQQAPPQAGSAGKDYGVLAQLTPPVYSPQTLRSAETDAGARFREGMLDYTNGSYTAAIPKLQAASQLNGKPLAPRFYLGACYLLTGDYSNAESALRAVLASGPSDFAEESRMLLAKAELKQNNPVAAHADLQAVAGGKGEFAAQAQALRQAIDQLQSSR